MFDDKFMLAATGFDAALREPYVSFPTRHQKFWPYIHEVLGWFAKEPSLCEVKLTVVTQLESEPNPLSVWIRHHFKLTTLGMLCPVPDANDYALSSLPYKEIGNGSFTLARDCDEVKSFLALHASVSDCTEAIPFIMDYRAIVAKIGFRVDASFDVIAVQHTTGIQTIAPD